MTRQEIITAITSAAAHLEYPAAKMTGIDALPESQKLPELAYDFDSLDYVEFIMEIEARVDSPLDEDAAPDLELSTVGDLAAWIEQQIDNTGGKG